MGNFRSDRDSRGGGFRGRSGGRSGGFGGGFGRDRGFGGRGRDGGRGFRDDMGERRKPEMHKAICDKCKKECEVPFKPTSGKPIFCSDCFKQEEPSRGSGSGMSSEQFNQLNTKLDKIIEFLNNIEFEDVDEDADEEEEDSEK